MYTRFGSDLSYGIGIEAGPLAKPKDRRIIIIDGCPLFREGLEQAFHDTSFDVIATASDLGELRLDESTTDGGLLIILATTDDDAADLRAVQDAQTRFPGSILVAMGQDCQPVQAARLLRAGASAILPTPRRAEDIVDVLELVTLGQRVVPLHLVSTCVSGGDPDRAEPCDRDLPSGALTDLDPKSTRLSIREIEILRCLLAGESNRSIARRLAIGEATVKVHIKAILRKIKVKNRTQAAIWAVGNMTGAAREARGSAAAVGRTSGPIPTLA